MFRRALVCSLPLPAAFVSFAWLLASAAPLAAQSSLAEYVAAFERHAGGKLAFTRSDLPAGEYHDVMYELSAERRLEAAKILTREVKKYPPRYFEQIGLKAFGVFAACVSKSGDGFRPYDEQLKGYRYYGIWNGENACAGAYYSDGQLPLTFHHEVFHHVDGSQRGVSVGRTHFTSDDARFRAAVSGDERYPPLRLRSQDLRDLKDRGAGYYLRNVVSDYSAKTAGEDQAETARHFMTNLADSLVQIAEQPDLPGSQRILHVLREYEQAAPRGPTSDWFLGVALERAAPSPTELADNGPPRVPALPKAIENAPAASKAPAAENAPFQPTLPPELIRPRPADEPSRDRPAPKLEPAPLLQPAPAPPENLVEKLIRLGEQAETVVAESDTRLDEARQLLRAAASLEQAKLADRQAEKLAPAAARLAHAILKHRIQPREDALDFVIRGQEDADGVNWTLRSDVANLGRDAVCLQKIADLAPGNEQLLTETQLKTLRWLARYYVFIDSKWSVTAGTKAVFEDARDKIVQALPAQQKALGQSLREKSLEDLAVYIRPNGQLGFENPYLSKVDAAVVDLALRAAIREVQPACVSLGGGSGVNLSPKGLILTAAHVPDRLGVQLTCRFPDGRRYTAKCVAIDQKLDLAVMELAADEALPFARLAKNPPVVGAGVVAIGQPSTSTPRGEPTGYKPFHVSVGRIRGLLDNPLGEQKLGRCKHDAWTYWGHSGCPLFNSAGDVVAIHNTWDSTTAMRHAVPHEAITHFLKQWRVAYAVGE